MLETPPLLTIKKPSRRPSDDEIAFFRTCPTSVVADAQMNAGVMATGISPLQGEVRVAGPALTVGCGPADVLALLAAQGVVAKGDVVLSSVDGHQGAAALGDLVAGRLKNAGAAGCVTDGPVRDAAGVMETGLPVWCTGRTPASPFNSGPGSVGLPIKIGGVQVETGDMIIADGDGVVAIAFAEIAKTMERAQQILALEEKSEAAVAAGETVPDQTRALLESDQVRWVD